MVAVTAADYQKAAQDFIGPDGSSPIQRASAAYRWNGSWLTVALGIDPVGGEILSSQLCAELLGFLDGVRLAGYDLEVSGASYVPIDLTIGLCVTPGFISATVEQGVLLALSNGVLAGGGKGFFHPDNFSFGDNVFVSRILAAVMSVAGVEFGADYPADAAACDQPGC